MDKIYELSRYVKFTLSKVDELYKLQLLDINDDPSDVGTTCIWEDDHFDLDHLFDQAITWCKKMMTIK